MFDALPFAIHIIHMLYSREAEAHSEVVRITARLDGMIAQNAFAREEMVRIGKAERLFEARRRELEAECAQYRGRINRLEQKLRDEEFYGNEMQQAIHTAMDALAEVRT